MILPPHRCHLLLIYLQMLAFSYGISFWPVPFVSTIQSEIATSVGSSAANGTWYELLLVENMIYIRLTYTGSHQTTQWEQPWLS